MNYYQIVDVLIIDDIQFLAGKQKTQDAFFHIFNQLQTLQKQIILTSDRSLSEIEDINDRLVSRFRWGVATQLENPDYETRVAIIKHYAEINGINGAAKLDDEIFAYIASHAIIPREMIGIITTILARATHDHSSIDLPLVEEITNEYIKNSYKQVTLETILYCVAQYYGMSPDVIRSDSRKRDIVLARHITMYYAHKFTSNSLEIIGKTIGNKDHSTVLHACKKVKEYLQTDKKAKIDIDKIGKKIMQN